ncbi:MAG: hypothetical protein IPN79_04415 [Saprospiraceae bacterium]|nr:hypothetical protein [Saprospiraceae bacterium]
MENYHLVEHDTAQLLIEESRRNLDDLIDMYNQMTLKTEKILTFSFASILFFITFFSAENWFFILPIIPMVVSIYYGYKNHNSWKTGSKGIFPNSVYNSKYINKENTDFQYQYVVCTVLQVIQDESESFVKVNNERIKISEKQIYFAVVGILLFILVYSLTLK